MELLYSNYFNTTTQAVVNSATDTVANLLERDAAFQYVSSGYTGVTVSTIRINFSETVSVSRIALIGHNAKKFRLFYNGATANAFTMTTTSATTTSVFSTNSETSIFMFVTPVNCTSISLDLEETMVAGAEKAIGHFFVSRVLHSFEREPPAKGYTPQLLPTNIKHTLSDGGMRIQTVGEKYKAVLSYTHLSESERNSLRTVWDMHSEMVYVPFGTTTSWDKILFPCVWDGSFDFYKYSDSAISGGFEGKITLLETPK